MAVIVSAPAQLKETLTALEATPLKVIGEAIKTHQIICLVENGSAAEVNH